MANLWDTLDDEQRQQLVKAHTAGNGGMTNENINRAREQLAQNPRLVDKLAKETGITEGEEVLQDGEDVAEGNEIESAVDAALEDDGDVQETGTVTKTRSVEERLAELEGRLDRSGADSPFRTRAPMSGTTPRADETLNTRAYFDENPDELDPGRSDPSRELRKEVDFDRDQRRRRDSRSPNAKGRRDGAYGER